MSRSRAFTLIELLVVISIIAVLTAVLLPNLIGIRGRAADARKKADLKDFQAALRLYYNDHQAYPGQTISPGQQFNPSVLGDEDTGRFTDGTYSTDLPEEAAYAPDGTDGYKMYAVLDNEADPDILTSQAKCGGSGTEAYYVCAQ